MIHYLLLVNRIKNHLIGSSEKEPGFALTVVRSNLTSKDRHFFSFKLAVDSTYDPYHSIFPDATHLAVKRFHLISDGPFDGPCRPPQCSS